MIKITVHNGLANRLLPLISIMRLAKQSNRKVNLIFHGTPVRSCLRYDGEHCKFEDLFEPFDNLILNDHNYYNFERTYNFEYWLNKDMIIDISGNCNIQTNFGLYTIISATDDSNMFKNLQNVIKNGCEIKFDSVGMELATVLRTLTPVKELRDEISKYHSMFLPNMIGIHIRSTDGGFVNIDWENIVNKLVSLCTKWTETKENGIFLATDNPKYYEQFKCINDKQLIFYEPPDVLCNTRTTNNDKFNNDKYNVLCGLVEMQLLGKCNRYIIGTSESTFSFCAMLLAPNDTKKYLINKIEHLPNF